MDAAATAISRLTLRARQSIHREALAFVAERYGLDAGRAAALAAIPVRWKRARGSSAFYLRAAHGFDGPHILLRVPGGSRVRWHTYRRARARFATPPGGIDLDVPTFAGAVLVHELTHALQHGVAGEPKRRYSEVETTENELEFVRRRAPEAYARLVPVLPKPRRRAGQPAAPASGLAALRAAVLRMAARVVGRLTAPASPPAPPPPRSRRRTRSPRPTGS
jgi:hypothetical protein